MVIRLQPRSCKAHLHVETVTVSQRSMKGTRRRKVRSACSYGAVRPPQTDSSCWETSRRCERKTISTPVWAIRQANCYPWTPRYAAWTRNNDGPLLPMSWGIVGTTDRLSFVVQDVAFRHISFIFWFLKLLYGVSLTLCIVVVVVVFLYDCPCSLAMIHRLTAMPIANPNQYLYEYSEHSAECHFPK